MLVACLALGVAAIAAIGSTRAALIGGLRADARALLGGDLELSSTTTTVEVPKLPAGSTTSQVTDLRAMAHHGERAALVELKGVDEAYPLYGVLKTTPANTTLSDGDALVDPLLATRLGVALDDALVIGDVSFRVRAWLDTEPDRGIRGFELGPRVMVRRGDIAKTGLVQPGSLVRDSVRVRLPATMDAEVVAEPLRAQREGTRVMTHRDATPGVKRFIDRVTQFLTLVGLTALLVGGVGVSNAVSTYLEGKLTTIATLKCVGASSRTVTSVYLGLTGALAIAGIAIGLVIGAAAPMLALPLIARALPVVARGGIYWEPLVQAAAFGIATALVFALWPLARVAEVKPAALFRSRIVVTRTMPRGPMLLVIIVAAAALAALVLFGARDLTISAMFVAAAAATFGAFALVAVGLRRMASFARYLPPSPLRIGLANIGRSGAPTTRTVLSLGLGLTVLAAIAVVESNLATELSPASAIEPPAFFFLDIQSSEADDFTTTVKALPGVSAIDSVPMLRGRITAIAGVPVDKVTIAERSRWAVESDRGITYAAQPPKGTQIVAGAWWPEDYSGPPLVSFDAELASDMGAKLGDTITFNVLGRDITATVASLRDIDWRNMGINFTVVLSPNALAGAPHTLLATTHAAAAEEEAIFQRIARDFPHVSTVRVRDAVTRLQQMISGIATAVRSAAALTLIMGVLVLAGGVIASHHRRVRDAVVLAVLGATRRTAALVFLVEHGATGFATALIASALGSAAAYGILVGLMELHWHPAPAALVITLLVGTATSLVVGSVGTWRALSQKPAALLRDE